MYQRTVVGRTYAQVLLLGKQNVHANRTSSQKCPKSLTRSAHMRGNSKNGYPRGTSHHTRIASDKKFKVPVQSHAGSVTGVKKQLSVGTDEQITLKNKFHVLQNTNQNGIQDDQGSKHFQVISTEKQAKVIKRKKFAPIR